MRSKLPLTLLVAAVLHAAILLGLHAGPRRTAVERVAPAREELVAIELGGETAIPTPAPVVAAPTAKHATAAAPTPAAAPPAESGTEPSGEPSGSAGDEAPTGAATAAPSSGQGGAGAIAIAAPTRSASLGDLLGRIRAARRYPELARRREIEGVVRISFEVGADGQPRGIVAVASPDPLLVEAAIDAIHRAAPLPRVDGRVEVDLDFQLSDGAK